MAELKPGGLALVIKSRFPENIGKAVRTDKFIGVSEPYFVSCWQVTALSPMAGTIYPAKEGDPMVAPAHALMPIDGDDFQHEDERQRGLIDGCRH